MDPNSFRDIQVQTRGEFGGLGIEVTMEEAWCSWWRRSTIRRPPKLA
jgi:C-terminal processing protease CtpA/Prc